MDAGDGKEPGIIKSQVRVVEQFDQWSVRSTTLVYQAKQVQEQLSATQSYGIPVHMVHVYIGIQCSGRESDWAYVQTADG